MPIQLTPGDLHYRQTAGIEKTENVCGGSARIVGTRIPVWLLVEARDLARARPSSCWITPACVPMISSMPGRTPAHPGEVEAEIRENEDA